MPEEDEEEKIKVEEQSKSKWKLRLPTLKHKQTMIMNNSLRNSLDGSQSSSTERTKKRKLASIVSLNFKQKMEGLIKKRKEEEKRLHMIE